MRRHCMPEDVEIAVVRPYSEEGGICAVPLIKHFFYDVPMAVHLEADGAFLGFPARIAFDAECHPLECISG